VETTDGCLPTEGTCAWVASAVALWRQHRDLLLDVLVSETPQATELLHCLTARRRDLFLLLAGRNHTYTWRCPPGEEKPLHRFVTALNREAARSAEAAAARRRATDEVVAELRGAPAVAEPPGPDHRFAAAVEAARCRLDEARQEPAELVAARQRAAAETGAVATPPPPLPVRA
ncbi:MAG TPA: hypothetical protein VOB72_17150, partial [Candidatus Dormibacteraeota bacterium]|nr:hypothetical protein [Candidatus Dormibacteraeota bacterium]